MPKIRLGPTAKTATFFFTFMSKKDKCPGDPRSRTVSLKKDKCPGDPRSRTVSLKKTLKKTSVPGILAVTIFFKKSQVSRGSSQPDSQT